MHVSSSQHLVTLVWHNVPPSHLLTKQTNCQINKDGKYYFPLGFSEFQNADTVIDISWLTFTGECSQMVECIPIMLSHSLLQDSISLLPAFILYTFTSDTETKEK